MSIHYTKVLTNGNKVVSVSKLQLMDRGIPNFPCEQAGRSVYCYTFQIGFDHSAPTDKNEQVFDQMTPGYPNVFPRSRNTC